MQAGPERSTRRDQLAGIEKSGGRSTMIAAYREVFHAGVLAALLHLRKHGLCNSSIRKMSRANQHAQNKKAEASGEAKQHTRAPTATAKCTQQHASRLKPIFKIKTGPKSQKQIWGASFNQTKERGPEFGVPDRRCRQPWRGSAPSTGPPTSRSAAAPADTNQPQVRARTRNQPTNQTGRNASSKTGAPSLNRQRI